MASLNINNMALPPGFRFHPTDEELVVFYLLRKVKGLHIQWNVISEIDLYKHDPWDLPHVADLSSCHVTDGTDGGGGHAHGSPMANSSDCHMGQACHPADKEWYFFNCSDRKYPRGSRTNRATGSGYWKATGRDRRVLSKTAVVGSKKTLVFYKGRAPHGQRTDWVMHEYQLLSSNTQQHQPNDPTNSNPPNMVVCRIVKKRRAAPHVSFDAHPNYSIHPNDGVPGGGSCCEGEQPNCEIDDGEHESIEEEYTSIHTNQNRYVEALQLLDRPHVPASESREYQHDDPKVEKVGLRLLDDAREEEAGNSKRVVYGEESPEKSSTTL